MGEGEQRRSKRKARFTTRDLAVFSKKNAPGEADWDARVATGTKPPLVLGSRTQTVDDPLTTSLLAEASRSRTLEVSPDQIDEATTLDEEVDDDALDEDDVDDGSGGAGGSNRPR